MKIMQGTNVPIKSWCNNPESGAIDQAKNLSKLPFIFKQVCLMPDCLSEDTEVLTSNGFKFISKTNKNELIANFNKENKRIYFSKPKDIIIRNKRKNEKIFEITNCHLDKSIIVTEKHRMVCIANMGIYAKDLPEKTQLKDYFWGGSGIINTEEFKISDELLCLIAWVVGDGNVKLTNKRLDGKFSSVNIRFGIRKYRKINRILSLLDSIGYKYSVKYNNKQCTIAICVKDSRYIVENYVGLTKEYPKEFISKLSHRQALIFLEECLKVDGDWIRYENIGSMRYNSKRESDINFLSSLIAIHLGMAKDNTRYTEGYKKILMHYLDATKNSEFIDSNSGLGSGVVLKKEIIYNGKVVCLTCDSGFFVARRKGMSFISGNCHQGFGMPIGGVIACKGVVIPNAVGVDIACGMNSVRTNIKEEDLKLFNLKKIIEEIKNTIPVGFKHHSNRQEWVGFDNIPNISIIENEIDSAKYQLGTLGGGNHFIEIQKGDDGYIWIMLHSGSRNFGYKIAKFYNKVAQDLCKKWYSNIPIFKGEDGLAFLPIQSTPGRDYLIAMNYALEFAKENRKQMMDKIKQIFVDIYTEKVLFDNEINIHHNYAAMENHFGQNVMIHRKGATSAYEGQYGIIPGSQGSFSYIVKGKGNIESFKSCSHGAGRKMSRSKAKANLSLEDEVNKLDKQGIIHSIKGIGNLDEASGAYKDINLVMAEQKDLVDILVKLQPLAVVKG